MKGVILAGGHGSRLGYSTKVTNKHLLPVYDRPMIMWPLKTLRDDLDIKDIMIVSGRGHAGHFLELLGSGQEYGVNLTYEIQESAGGIAEALFLARNFANREDIAVILGDNIFEKIPKDALELFFSSYDQNRDRNAMIFTHTPEDLNQLKRFGVAEIDEKSFVKRIEEKPKKPKSDKIVTGLYLYDSSVFNRILKCKYSKRHELEITDVNNSYAKDGHLLAYEVDGWWTDAGTPDSLLTASYYVQQKLNLDALQKIKSKS